MSAVPHLQKQLKDLTQHPIAGFRVEVGDDLFKWTVWFAGPPGTLYEGGQYRGELEFPSDFPYKPPKFRVLSSIWHPNVYENGLVCISILHDPGVDPQNSVESAAERWTPIQSIASVLISILSLLADPDPTVAGAPANVEALIMYRKDRHRFVERCKENAKKSLAELPKGWVPPPTTDEKPAMTKEQSTLSEAVFMDDEDEEEPVPAAKHHGGPYAAELQSLRSMGVAGDKSDEELAAMLTKYKGDISRVLDNLY